MLPYILKYPSLRLPPLGILLVQHDEIIHDLQRLRDLVVYNQVSTKGEEGVLNLLQKVSVQVEPLLPVSAFSFISSPLP